MKQTNYSKIRHDEAEKLTPQLINILKNTFKGEKVVQSSPDSESDMKQCTDCWIGDKLCSFRHRKYCRQPHDLVFRFNPGVDEWEKIIRGDGKGVSVYLYGWRDEDNKRICKWVVLDMNRLRQYSLDTGLEAKVTHWAEGSFRTLALDSIPSNFFISKFDVDIPYDN